MKWTHSPKAIFKDPIHLVAFGFGSGLPGKAPGTWGTLAALPVYALLLAPLNPYLQLLIILLAFGFGIWVCDISSRKLGVKDHPGIVWDEWVGLWLTLIFVPTHWMWWLIGFAAFRAFDILKPGPIGWLDKRLKGGLGIMADDLLAGLFAGLVVGASAWGLK